MESNKLRRQLLASAVLVLSYLTVGCGDVLADGGLDQNAVNRAANYLRSVETGKGVLNFVHMGADYRGHSYLRTTWVNDSDGYRIPGQFALVYRFFWEDDGVTDLAFLCNAQGGIYRVQVMSSNAQMNQPFLFADAAIQILGNAMVEAYKNQLTRAQLRLLHQFVDNADAKGLMELVITVGENAQN